MRDIEILSDSETGAPVVTLHGEAKVQAEAKGVKKILISLSHSEVCKFSPGSSRKSLLTGDYSQTVAIAFAQASKTA